MKVVVFLLTSVLWGYLYFEIRSVGSILPTFFAEVTMDKDTKVVTIGKGEITWD
jgi:hypothetical protein